MRKTILYCMALTSVSGAAFADSVDVYEGRNSLFNHYLGAKGIPACISDTYFSYVLTEEGGVPSEASQATEFRAFESVYTEEDKLLKRVADGNSLTLYTEKAGKWQSVTKSTYIDGYSFLQSCVTKFL